MKKVFILLSLLLANQAQAQFIVNNGIEISNSTTLSSNGEWVTEGNFLNAGTIVLRAGFTNTGTLTAPSGGGFIIENTDPLNFSTNTSSVGFLVKQGSGTVFIGGLLSVVDSLQLENGLIAYLSESDLLRINSGTLVRVNNNAHVDNRMASTGNGTQFFPIGKDGVYLPLRIFNVSGTNTNTTARVNPASGTFTAGAGVEALVDFPYVWSTTKSATADTASFVQIQYPSNLLVAANPIVARQVGTTYRGMGARSISTQAGTTTVTSYSRGLQGNFTIARGFGGNLETDSLALVALYNSTNGANWTKRTNWLSGPIVNWQGITETGGTVTSVVLDQANIVGSIPEQFTDILALQTANFASNEIQGIPDFNPLTALASLNLSNNRLDYADIVPNLGVTGFNYSNQKAFGPSQEIIESVGSTVLLSSSVGGTGNQYQWFRNSVAVTDEQNSDLLIENLNYDKMGNYTLEVTHPSVLAVNPSFKLVSNSNRVLAKASISGSIRDGNNNAVNAGQAYLFRITESGKYDTIRFNNQNFVNIGTNGNYTMNDVILDDYIVLANPSAGNFPNLIPSYFQGTIYWEDADTFVHRKDSSQVNITLQGTPAPLQGSSSIGGFFEEEDSNARFLNRTRVQGGGVTLSRTSSQNRDTRVLADQLVAYLRTDANGNFNFGSIPQGNYQIKFEYPGVPMDLGSDVFFSLNEYTEVDIAATVIDGVIKVETLRVLGFKPKVGANNPIKYFPNPTNDQLNLIFAEDLSGHSEISLIDMAGRIVHSQAHLLNGEGLTLHLGHLPKGLYILKVSQASGTVAQGRVSIK